MTETMIERLGDYGILGLTVIALGYIGLRLWQDLSTSWQSRLVETRELVEVVHKAASNYETLTRALTERSTDLSQIETNTRETREGLHELAQALRGGIKAQQDHRELLERLMRHVEQEGGEYPPARRSNNPPP